MRIKTLAKKGMAIMLAASMVFQGNSFSLLAEENIPEEVIQEETIQEEVISEEEVDEIENSQEIVDDEIIVAEEESYEAAVSISGTYAFNDKDDTSNRPATLTVSLYRGEEKVDEQTLEVQDSGSWSFEVMEDEYSIQYDFNGNEFYEMTQTGNDVVYSLKETSQFVYEDAKVKVVATVYGEQLPESYSFAVKELNNVTDKTAYYEAVNKLGEYENQNDISIQSYLVYDMHFEDANGNEVEPNGTVKVNATYKQVQKLEDATNDNTVVLHLDETINQFEDVTTNVDVDGNGNVQAASFVTDSFSTIAIVAVGEEYEVTLDAEEGFDLSEIRNGWYGSVDSVALVEDGKIVSDVVLLVDNHATLTTTVAPADAEVYFYKNSQVGAGGVKAEGEFKQKDTTYIMSNSIDGNDITIKVQTPRLNIKLNLEDELTVEDLADADMGYLFAQFDKDGSKVKCTTVAKITSENVEAKYTKDVYYYEVVFTNEDESVQHVAGDVFEIDGKNYVIDQVAEDEYTFKLVDDYVVSVVTEDGLTIEDFIQAYPNAMLRDKEGKDVAAQAAIQENGTIVFENPNTTEKDLKVFFEDDVTDESIVEINGIRYGILSTLSDSGLTYTVSEVKDRQVSIKAKPGEYYVAFADEKGVLYSDVQTVTVPSDEPYLFTIEAGSMRKVSEDEFVLAKLFTDESGATVKKSTETEKILYGKDEDVFTIEVDGILTPGAPTSTEAVLGEAANIGIVANALHLDGHFESNFATGTMIGNAQPQAPKNDGGGAGAVYIGEYIGSGFLYKTNGNIGNVIIYTTDDAASNFAHPAMSLYDESTGHWVAGQDVRSYTVIDTTTYDSTQIQSYVSSMVNYAAESSAQLKANGDAHGYNASDVIVNKTLDLTNSKAGTYYINFAPGEYDSMKNGLTVKINSGQTVVLNIPDSTVNVVQYHLYIDGTESVVDGYDKSDVNSRRMIFNAYNATSASTDKADGTFVFPYATFRNEGPSAGWVVANNITKMGGQEWHFQNKRVPEISYSLKAKKSVNGKDVSDTEDGIFNFDLYRIDENGNRLSDKPIESVKNKGGDIEFTPFDNITLNGIYWYEIVESGVVQGYTMDPAIFRAKAVISISGEKRVADVTYYKVQDGKLVEQFGTPIFDNKKEETHGEISIPVIKDYEGKDWEDETFDFNIEAVDGAPICDETTITLDKDRQTDEFGPIEFTEAGTYQYKVSEKAGRSTSIEYDDAIYLVTVEVDEDLEASITKIENIKEQPPVEMESIAAVTFTNTYTAEGSIKLVGTKAIVGRNMKDGEVFTFVVKDEDEKVITTVDVKDGTTAELSTIDFGTIQTIETPGDQTFTYTVSEVTPASVWAPSGETYTIVVKAIDNGDGSFTYQLQPGTSDNVLITGGNVITLPNESFTNEFVARGETNLKAYKQVNDGKDPIPSNIIKYDFTLSLTDTLKETKEAGESYEEKGSYIADVNFDTISYDLKQDENGIKIIPSYDESKAQYLDAKGQTTFTYTIKEEIPSDATDNKDGTYTKGQFVYDGHTVTVNVTVSDKGNGELNIVTSYSDGDRAIFKNKIEEIVFNTTTLELPAIKHVNGKTPKDGQVFTFTMVQKEDDTYTTDAKDGIKYEATNNGEEVYFEEITYDFSQLNQTFYYLVQESIPATLGSMEYDETLYGVAVTVVKVSEEKIGTSLKYTSFKLDPETGEYVDKEEAESVVFNNKNKPETYDEFGGKKQLTGKPWEDESFNFDLYYGDKVIDTQTVTKDSEDYAFEFNQIKYVLSDDQTKIEANIEGYDANPFATVALTEDKDGLMSAVLNFTVKEQLPDADENGLFILDGITYDASQFDIKVTVTYNEAKGDMIADVEVTCEGESVEDIIFKNNYEAKGELSLDAKKVAENFELKGDDFSFILEENGKQIETKKNDKDGNVKFGEIKYVLSEDQRQIEVQYEDGTTENVDLINDQALLTYAIREDIPEETKGITYDKAVKEINVTVTHDKKGHLIVDKEYLNGDVVFTNTYKSSAGVIFNGKKKLDGKSWNEIDQEFKTKLAGNTEFTLSELDEKTNTYKVLDTAILQADGTFTFLKGQPIKYELSRGEKQTHTYKVVETKTYQGINIDKKEYICKVEVEDKEDGTAIVKFNGVESAQLEITTTFNNSTTPQTGVHQNVGGYIGAMTVAVLGAVLLVLKKKNN